MTIFGYARVATDGQTLDVQGAALAAAGATRVFHDRARSAQGDRQALTKALGALMPGDILLVTRLNRLARSSRDLLNILDSISKAGAGFRSLGDPWADTTTPHGRLKMTVLGGLAEFERELVCSRTGEGRERAKARGVRLGRPAALAPRQRQEARASLASGAATQADLARRFNVSQSTISRLVNNTELPPFRLEIDADTERAARAFMGRLRGRYSIRDAILFGSRARGTHSPESDADIAVVLSGPHGDRSAAALDMAGIAFDAMLETGILVEALPLWEDEIAHPGQFGNPTLIDMIRRDGVRL